MHDRHGLTLAEAVYLTDFDRKTLRVAMTAQIGTDVHVWLLKPLGIRKRRPHFRVNTFCLFRKMAIFTAP